MKLRPRSVKFSCPYPKCGRVFSRETNLRKHLLYECSQMPCFKCPYCDHVSNDKYNMQTHIRVKHKNRDVYVIDIFQLDNKRPTVYSCTKKRKPRNGVQFPCPNTNCRSVFTWEKNLKRHLHYRCGQKPRFKCPYCDYVCKAKGDIRKHIRTQHENCEVYVIDILEQLEVCQ